MSSLFRDLRYGVRLLLRQPTFTLAVVITLALAIGANTAIFTVVNAALLRSLPYRDPDALVHLWETKPQKEFPTREASYPDFVAVEGKAQILQRFCDCGRLRWRGPWFRQCESYFLPFVPV